MSGTESTSCHLLVQSATLVPVLRFATCTGHALPSASHVPVAAQTTSRSASTPRAVPLFLWSLSVATPPMSQQSFFQRDALPQCLASPACRAHGFLERKLVEAQELGGGQGAVGEQMQPPLAQERAGTGLADARKGGTGWDDFLRAAEGSKKVAESRPRMAEGGERAASSGSEYRLARLWKRYASDKPADLEALGLDVEVRQRLPVSRLAVPQQGQR